MIPFQKRRTRNLSILAGCAIVCVIVYRMSNISLQQTNYITGWGLFLCMLFLTFYNLRKKLTFLPVLFRSAIWLQFHVYVGLLTIVIFALHLNLRFPDGLFEVLLTLFFIAVVASGVFGIYITRKFPPRLTLRGEEVIFERIPIFIRNIREDAEKLVTDAVEEHKSTTIGNLYNKKLVQFFSKPRNYFYHILNSRRAFRNLMLELELTERYLNAQEKEVLKSLKELVEVKDDLDYHHALQATIKGWLFFHIPVTYGLMLFALVHIGFVYAFFGG